MNHQFNNKKINRNTFFYRFRRSFINPFTTMMFSIGIIALFADYIFASDTNKNLTTVVIIGIMILISGAIRFVQEVRAKEASDRIINILKSNVTVRRQGILIEISSENLIVGDIVLLNPGNRVPGDIKLTKARDLRVSQASLTGESQIVRKTSENANPAQTITDTNNKNMVFMSTSIISGKGEGEVVAVGNDTVYGKFSSNKINTKNSFAIGANSIVRVMLKFMAVLVPIVFIIAGVTKGNWTAAFIFSLSVAIGLTPEMLPMVITACLAKGSMQLLKHEALVKNIEAMQGMGSMDVLCVDKTGTLTKESILLEYYMDIIGNESESVLESAFLNSYFHSGVDNPIDLAVIKWKNVPKNKEKYEKLIHEYKKIDELPFDFNRKMVSILLKNDKGQQIFVKGDIDSVFNKCSYIEYNEKSYPIDKNQKANMDLIVNDMLEDGMKVIAVAKKTVLDKEKLLYEDEKGLTLIGYLAFFDAPKKSAKESLIALKNLNVRPVVMTGDRREIAISVCKRVGINTDYVITGDMLDSMSDEHLKSVVEQVDVFAQLSPGQKVRLVQMLKEQNHTVGFLGDGLNDIPALNEADVGISVDTGVGGTKEVADIVLLHKDLMVLEKGIVEGRKTFINMLKYIKITASSNYGNILSIVFASAFLPFLPMTAIQLLLLNILYDTLCIILPWDQVDEEDIKKPKLWSGNGLLSFMMSFGPISSIFDIITFLFLYFILCPALCGVSSYKAILDAQTTLKFISIFQTGWFLESMWTQVMILHLLRTKKKPFIQSKASNPVIFTTIIGIILFTLITFTPVASILGLTKMPIIYFAFLTGIVVCYMLLTYFAKCIYQKHLKKLL